MSTDFSCKGVRPGERPEASPALLPQAPGLRRAAAVDEGEVGRSSGGCLPARHRGRGGRAEKNGATRLTARSGAMPGKPDGRHACREKERTERTVGSLPARERGGPDDKGGLPERCV